MLALKGAQFPTSDRLIRAWWAPILLRPILGSPEQFVIGVAAVNETGFHIERANCLDRLYCVFSEAANSAIIAAEAGLDSLRDDLSYRALDALRNYKPLFSGVVLGDLAEAQGATLQAIASSWMASLSSVYTSDDSGISATAVVEISEGAYSDRQRDRLPSLILDYVNSQRPGLSSFFSEEIREKGPRRRSNASAVLIDYAGSRLVANFGTLTVANHAMSVDRLKRRLWDLKVDRDNEKGVFVRDHEMLVQHPAGNDPQFSNRQHQRISDALSALEEQADQEQLRFRPMHTVEAIGNHLLQKEAA
jgi:hypothetical protein